MAFEYIWTKKQRDSKTRIEKKKLLEIFTNLAEDKKKVADGLIDNAAFQRVMLMELTEIIKRDGYIEEYQNGENQKGYKKSSAADTYDKTLNTYSKIIKQLCDMLPSDVAVPGAEIMNFIRGKR